MIRILSLIVLFLGVQCVPILAADISVLRTSDYIPADDSLNVPKVAKVDIGEKEIDLSMELDSFAANADGDKYEGSASTQGQMIIAQPNFIQLPNLTITVSGHIVKTLDSTARLDVQAGPISHNFMWGAQDVKSGQFELTYNEVMPKGKVPAIFSVSALAFVSKSTPDAVVLISVEKIHVKLGALQATAEK